jgi:hypothetical protein
VDWYSDAKKRERESGCFCDRWKSSELWRLNCDFGSFLVR